MDQDQRRIKFTVDLAPGFFTWKDRQAIYTVVDRIIRDIRFLSYVKITGGNLIWEQGESRQTGIEVELSFHFWGLPEFRRIIKIIGNQWAVLNQDQLANPVTNKLVQKVTYTGWIKKGDIEAIPYLVPIIAEGIKKTLEILGGEVSAVLKDAEKTFETAQKPDNS
jgi:hypothetical protein